MPQLEPIRTACSPKGPERSTGAHAVPALGGATAGKIGVTGFGLAISTRQPDTLGLIHAGQWGWPEVRPRLLQGRDLLGREEPRPGEALGGLCKLTFWGLDAFISTNTSPRVSQDLEHRW